MPTKETFQGIWLNASGFNGYVPVVTRWFTSFLHRLTFDSVFIDMVNNKLFGHHIPFEKQLTAFRYKKEYQTLLDTLFYLYSFASGGF